MVRIVRYVGEIVVPDEEIEEITRFVEEVFKKCDLGTECDLGEGRIDRVVIVKTFYDAVMKFYKKRNIYYVVMNFKSKRAEIALLSASIEVNK